MDIKIQVQVIVASILCFGLLMVALYIMLIGPIREILKDETAFTESYQKINGKILIIKLYSLKIEQEHYFKSGTHTLFQTNQKMMIPQ